MFAEGYVESEDALQGMIDEPRARVVLQRSQIESFSKNLDLRDWVVPPQSTAERGEHDGDEVPAFSGPD